MNNRSNWYLIAMVVIVALFITGMFWGAKSNSDALDACEKAGGVAVGNAQTCIKKDAVIHP